MTTEPLLYAAAALGAANLLLLVALLIRGRALREPGLERALRDEMRAGRAEQSDGARALREEVDQRLAAVRDGLDQMIRRVDGAREDYHKSALALREELTKKLDTGHDAALRSLGEITAMQQTRLQEVEARLKEFGDSNQAALERLRETLSQHLKDLQSGNEKKLDEMRATVDEKLHGALEKRLGESFQLVSERLEAVQRGLGEMQSLATGVGDLKRVLTNVKTRGIWGEYQLQAILEQILTPDQYVANYRPREESGEVVEFAIRLPGRVEDGDPVFLPIDSKFPQEDYQRLLDAAERADPEAMQAATAALNRSVLGCAKDICDKYLNPPATTDFAIMFLPTEGLYAEVLRQPGLVQQIQSTCRVVIAGPTTLAAILSSLRMGFRTVAIERRSSEVWQVLGAVKTEFGKFGKVLETLKRQLNSASNTIEDTGVRTRMMEKKLKQVEELPADLAITVLGLSDGASALAAGNDDEITDSESE